MNALGRKLEYASRVAGSGLCLVTFGLACVLVSLTVFPLIYLTSPDPATKRRRVRRCMHASYGFFIGMGRRLGVISYELHGGERLAASGQLVIANHPSLIDVLLLGTQLPQVNCIAKESLMRNIFLGAPLRWADYIPNGTADRLIEDCVASLQSGNSLLIFPEGTRSVPGQPLKMRRGAAHIALALGCDLLPVTIVCNPSALTKTDVWYRVPPRRPHWCITVGEPIRLADLQVPGEPESRSARRVTAYLQDYFGSHIGVSMLPPVAAVESPQSIARRLAMAS